MNELRIQALALESVPSLTLCIQSVVPFKSFIQEGQGHLIPIEPEFLSVYRLYTPEMVGDMSLIIKTADGLVLRINRNIPTYVRPMRPSGAIEIQFSHGSPFGIQEVLRDGRFVTWHAQQICEGAEYITELSMSPGQSVRCANREFEQVVSVQ